MELTNDILSLRPYLFGMAYNMLGVIEEAEDIVQDIFEKWLQVKEAKQPKAYLGRMVVNKSIDRLNELKNLRENYKGYWLPEPYITWEQEGTPTLEYGLLFLLERLNPIERAVFILRESFSEEYASIGEITGLSQDNCRQVLHRAHEKLGRAKNKMVDPVRQNALSNAFLEALHGNDVTSLGKLLREDIELFNDGGGKRAAALKPLFGLAKVLKFLSGIMRLPENQNNEFEYKNAFVNGRPGALIFRRSNGELDSMQYVESDENNITRLLYVRNPDKLKIRA
ncbi:MAG: RNA polymerase subunit sigma-24 [Bacteroidia bacterium]|nr:RNA polymerase subunit sigma-24 [Bacteroidia bacterium]